MFQRGYAVGSSSDEKRQCKSNDHRLRNMLDAMFIYKLVIISYSAFEKKSPINLLLQQVYKAFKFFDIQNFEFRFFKIESLVNFRIIKSCRQFCVASVSYGQLPFFLYHTVIPRPYV